MSKIRCSIILCLFAYSCNDSTIDNDFENSPFQNFDLFWGGIDSHSSMIYAKSINWDSIYSVYRPLVNDDTDSEELWLIFSDMIEVFDDEHTVIFSGDRAYVSGSHRIDDAINSFSKEVIRDNYLDYIKDFDVMNEAPDFSYGKIKNKNIGYIYIGDTDGNNPSLLMDRVLEEIGDTKAIIFDVRNNGGGLGSFAEAVTDHFAEETRLAYSTQTRDGLAYNDFDKLTEFYNTSDEINQYLKPVIVLTDARSVSGAENMVVFLKLNSQVTQLGDTTAGAFSSLSNRRFLPNGWNYRYPVQISYSPEGIFLDGDGLIPDVYSKNTPSNVGIGKDQNIEDALLFLFNEYGID